MSAYDDIYHHGIKGMRWGIRRDRGPDGTVGGASVISVKTTKRPATKKDAKDFNKTLDLIKKKNLQTTKGELITPGGRFEYDEKTGDMKIGVKRYMEDRQGLGKPLKKPKTESLNLGKINEHDMTVFFADMVNTPSKMVDKLAKDPKNQKLVDGYEFVDLLVYGELAFPSGSMVDPVKNPNYDLSKSYYKQKVNK